MSDFEELKRHVRLASGSISFSPIDESEIDQAEDELGFLLPSALREFYRFVGSGWIAPNNRPDVRNLFIHPLDVVDILQGTSPFTPGNMFLKGDLPIFDCGGDRFLVVRPASPNPQEVFRDDGSKTAVAKDLSDLVSKLLVDPVFYEGPK